MTKCLQIMCAKYYKLMYMFKKKCTQKTAPRQSWRICLIRHQNSRFFFKTQRIKVYTRDNLDPGPRCSPWQCVRACYSCSNARAPRDNHAQNGRLSCTWNSVLRRTKANSKIIKPTSSLTKNMSHCYSIKATYTYIIDTEKWYRKWPITIKLLLRWFKHKLRKTTKPNTAGY